MVFFPTFFNTKLLLVCSFLCVTKYEFTAGLAPLLEIVCVILFDEYSCANKAASNEPMVKEIMLKDNKLWKSMRFYFCAYMH